MLSFLYRITSLVIYSVLYISHQFYKLSITYNTPNIVWLSLICFYCAFYVQGKKNVTPYTNLSFWQNKELFKMDRGRGSLRIELA